MDGEKYDGKTMKRLRANNGDITDLKQAMDELSAIGVTFPRALLLLHPRRFHHRSGQRDRPEAVLHRQLRR